MCVHGGEKVGHWNGGVRRAGRATMPGGLSRLLIRRRHRGWYALIVSGLRRDRAGHGVSGDGLLPRAGEGGCGDKAEEDGGGRQAGHGVCLIPGFDGAVLSREWKDALWAGVGGDCPFADTDLQHSAVAFQPLRAVPARIGHRAADPAESRTGRIKSIGPSTTARAAG